MRREIFAACVAGAVAIVVASTAAWSGTPAAGGDQNQSGATTPPGNVPLSKKLDKNEGVLKPPHGIDPEIRQPPPAKTGDKMPVIIPPGEPGGDQSIQPK